MAGHTHFRYSRMLPLWVQSLALLWVDPLDILASILALDNVDNSDQLGPRPLPRLLFSTEDIRPRDPEVESG